MGTLFRQWLNKLPERESLDFRGCMYYVSNMPAEIRGQALDAMDQDFRMQHRREEIKENNQEIRRMREDVLLCEYLKLPGILSAFTLDDLGLKLGSPEESLIANILINSSIFSVSHRGQLRPTFKYKNLACPNGYCLRYTGDQLYMLDLKVFAILIAKSRQKFDVNYVINTSEIIRQLHLCDSGNNYRLIKETIFRLNHSELYFAKRLKEYASFGDDWHNFAKTYCATTIRLVDRVEWHAGVIRFSLDGRLVHFYDNCQYALLNLNELAILRGELTQKLFCMFITSKDNMQRHRLERIRSYAGLTSENKSLHRTVKAALSELLTKKIISAFWLSSPPYGESSNRSFVVWMNSQQNEVIKQVPSESGTLYLVNCSGKVQASSCSKSI